MPFFVPNEIYDIETSWADVLGDRCAPGFTRKNNMCVLDSNDSIRYKIPETVGYDFKYYQNGGELVGTYTLYTASHNMIPQYVDEPVLVSEQPLPLDLSVSRPSTFLRSDCLFLSVDRNTDMTRFTSNTWTQETDKHTYVTFGQFFLLNNHPSAIKTINLNFDIAYLDDGDITYADEAILHKGYQGFIDEDSPIQWQIGISRVQNSDRPYNMKGTLYPSARNPVSGTETLYEWNQVGESCTRWFDIWDYDSLNEYFGETDLLVINEEEDGMDLEATMSNLASNLQTAVSLMPAGQYVLNVRAKIDRTKLQAIIDEIADGNPAFDNTTFNVVLYPPTFYLFPSDTITKTIYPPSNKVNRSIDSIIFKLPNNYKLDGNFQFRLQFLERPERLIEKAEGLWEREVSVLDPYADFHEWISYTSSNVIFETVSFISEDSYEEFINTNDYSGDYVLESLPNRAVFELDKWSYSFDMIKWASMADIGGVIPVIPKFANTDYESYGVSSESDIYIKYTLSEEAKDAILSKSDIIYRISLIDGTLL